LVLDEIAPWYGEFDLAVRNSDVGIALNSFARHVEEDLDEGKLGER
jgi:hypothetical protein